ncbi:condensin subunit ScpB [Desulfonispora thiosulfatigenes DSM 11270]|uniref:Condensin subunit ScpB n=1 Tax=Desulfonispora thiosulfatigenes DSM 11270 TaxID=656914 RepID=A0A1W1VM35_DESTI|nr:SMC-Scp complex subunit ScpB [Desulfonispora thiosulfatigenes]SMB94353.1 condensin subunit ScpB [Desulfonispora thiosulfatigenes DSM 11270]
MLFFSEKIIAAIECVLFASNEPLKIEQICEIVKIKKHEAIAILEDMIAQYNHESHGFYLSKIAGGYQFITKPEYFNYVEKLYKPKLSTLSTQALETLSIIAYKQPVTKSEIEIIRGVKVDKTINTLMEKKLIKEDGRKDVIGKPILYSTTKDFLRYFGLETINQLPPLQDKSCND